MRLGIVTREGRLVRDGKCDWRGEDLTRGLLFRQKLDSAERIGGPSVQEVLPKRKQTGDTRNGHTASAKCPRSTEL